MGNLPPAERAEFNRHLGGCRYCQGVVDEYSEIGQIIKNFPRTSSRQPTLKTGPSPRWSQHSPSRGPRPTATRGYPIPGVSSSG